MLDRPIGPVWVTGRVVAQDVLPEGVRIVLADPEIGRYADGPVPDRVRVRLKRDAMPLPTGAGVGVLAMLNPPSGPAAPGPASV